MNTKHEFSIKMIFCDVKILIIVIYVIIYTESAHMK